MLERKAIAVLLSREMIIGFNVLMHSLLKYNKWLCEKKYDIIIFDDNLKLTDRISIVTKFFECNILFVDVMKNNYLNVKRQGTNERLVKTYYKLEMFRKVGDYERIVFMDVDMVITGDISELFTMPVEYIAGVKGYHPKEDRLHDYINSGVLVVSKNCINDKVYNDLLKMACDIERKLPDQEIINEYFKGKINFLPKIYNVEKRMEGTNNFKDVLEDKRIVHYVNYKPWENHKENEKYPAMISLWLDYYRMFLNEREHIR